MYGLMPRNCKHHYVESMGLKKEFTKLGEEHHGYDERGE